MPTIIATGALNFTVTATNIRTVPRSMAPEIQYICHSITASNLPTNLPIIRSGHISVRNGGAVPVSGSRVGVNANPFGVTISIYR